MPSIVGVDRAGERSARSTCETNTLAVVALAISSGIFVSDSVASNNVKIRLRRLSRSYSSESQPKRTRLEAEGRETTRRRRLLLLLLCCVPAPVLCSSHSSAGAALPV
jgi:hypothetical protein